MAVTLKRNAAATDAPITSKMEGSVLDMVQKSQLAAKKDAPIMPLKDESAAGTGGNTPAIVRDAQTMPKREKFVEDMAQKSPLLKRAITKDALI